MRILAFLAAGTLLSARPEGTAARESGGSRGEWKLDAGGVTSAAHDEDFSMADGIGIGAAWEKAFRRYEARLGVRGGALDFDRRAPDYALPGNYQEYGVALEALLGPAMEDIGPKLGGHVGYVRQDWAGAIDDVDALDVGADAMFSLELTPKVGVQAVLSPLWLLGGGGSDYQTRGAVNVEITLPGG